MKEWRDKLPQVAVVVFVFLICCFWGGTMSHLLSEQWCGIINSPASPLPAPAEACRFSRLPEVVKTRGRMEGGKRLWRGGDEGHIYVDMRAYKESIQKVVDTHKNTATHLRRHKEIDSFSFFPMHVHADTHQPNRSYCVKWKAQMRSWMDWWTVFITFQSAF